MSPEPDAVYEVMRRAYEAGIRVEMVEGTPTWEAFPGYRHQRILKQVEQTVKVDPHGGHGCGCFSIQDTDLLFPDGSYKRPDLAIYCEEPPDAEGAQSVLPQAVVEILSPGYERKDMVVGPPFYLKHGISDVVVIDPRSGTGRHFTRKSEAAFTSPTTIKLQCGCSITG